MATKFTAERKLPSCALSPRDAKSLEDELVRRVSDLSGIPSDTLRGNLEVGLIDTDGINEVRSVPQCNSNYFKNGTYALVFIVASSALNNDGAIEVTFGLHTDPDHSKISVEYKGEGAREKAISIRDSVLDAVEPYRNWNWIFRPAHGSPSTFSFWGFLTTGVGIYGLFAINPTPKLDVLYALAGVLILVYRVGSWVKPYTVFRSPRQQLRLQVWNWTTGGIALTILGWASVTLISYLIARWSLTSGS